MRADIAFPQAAKANKAMFCHADGTAKTVGEVYASVVNRPPPQMQTGRANPPLQMVAANIEAADMGRMLMSPKNTSAADAKQIALSDGDEPQEPAVGNPYAIWTSPERPAAGELHLLLQPPVVLSAGFVEMLASLTPVATMRRAI